MVTADVVLKGVAAAISLTFSLVLLRAARGRRDRERARERADPKIGPDALLLALFFALIGGNQAAETLRGLDAARGELWFHVAAVFAALDPAAIAAFAAVRTKRSWPVTVTAPISLAFVVASPWMVPLPRSVVPQAIEVALIVYTTTVYTFVLVAFAREVIGATVTDSPARRALYLATCFACIPLWGRTVGAVGVLLAFAPGLTFLNVIKAGINTVALLVGIGIYLLWAGRHRVLVGPALAGLALGLALNVPSAMEEIFGAAPPLVLGIGRGAAAIRWLLFAALASSALFRYGEIAMSLAERRRAARVFLALGFLLVGGIALLGLDAIAGGTAQVGAFEFALLVGLVLMSQGFSDLRDRFAERIYGVPRLRDAAGRHEAYRAAAAARLARGAPLDDPQLLALRDELGIDADTAASLERLADEANGAPLGAGQLVAGRYRIEHLLGRGGSARVWLAHDDLVGRRLVIKEVPDEGGAQWERRLAEARVAGALQHPNVLTLYDILRRPGRALLLMEFAEGGTLADRERGTPASEVQPILLGVARALAAMHERGILHLDVKPENVMLTKHGVPKLGDFGIAQHAQRPTSPAATGLFVGGTAGRMAPEQESRGALTPATDVFAWGLLARELADGAVGPEMEAVIARALAPDPAARWKDAGELADALERATRASQAQ